MATPPGSHLQNILQAAVQSVKWTYSLFWRICPQQGILIWGDGYYNGPIKTRKTVQPMEVSAEEASLQRSQQLRELYDSLSAGETNQPARRPCAALSPEDLTETEWFYLMCVSFSYPPGVGLPGKAYSRRQHVWLTGANEVDSKTFTRAILAKSARIQTVVCIPLQDGVVELGTTERVEEDIGFTAHVKSFFIDHQHPGRPPKLALSEHSTCNPGKSSVSAMTCAAAAPGGHPEVAAHHYQTADEHEGEEDEDEEEEEEADSDSEAQTGRADSRRAAGKNHQVLVGAAEQSELMQLEMSEDIRLGSPDDLSNNLDSDFHVLTVNQAGNAYQADHQRRVDAFPAESSRSWPMMQQPLRSGHEAPPSGLSQLDELSQEDTHYSQMVSTILQSQQPSQWAELSSTSYISYSAHSAFSKWSTAQADHLLYVPTEHASQVLLKYILFSAPFLHNKFRDENSPKSRDSESTTRIRKSTSQDELSANHVLAERRRREKLNERFIMLRSLVPFVTKMDKASILGDTIEYVKQLRKKIQDLEEKNMQIEADQRSRLGDPEMPSRVQPGIDKRKMRIVEGVGTVKPKVVESTKPTLIETNVQVSIIESNGLIELQCPHKEGLLLDVMQMLRDLRIEITTVQSSLAHGLLTAELRVKVKENQKGKKASIVEVKRAIQQLIPLTES